MIVRELKSIEEMLKYLKVLNELYPYLTEEEYEVDLREMLPHNYGQVAVFEGEECLGISGFWIGKKLWCGKYLELDNIVVSAKHRSRGVGKLIFDYLADQHRQRLFCLFHTNSSHSHNQQMKKFCQISPYQFLNY